MANDHFGSSVGRDSKATFIPNGGEVEAPGCEGAEECYGVAS